MDDLHLSISAFLAPFCGPVERSVEARPRGDSGQLRLCRADHGPQRPLLVAVGPETDPRSDLSIPLGADGDNTLSPAHRLRGGSGGGSRGSRFLGGFHLSRSNVYHRIKRIADVSAADACFSSRFLCSTCRPTHQGQLTTTKSGCPSFWIATDVSRFFFTFGPLPWQLR